jgi:hypothetical protein
MGQHTSRQAILLHFRRENFTYKKWFGNIMVGQDNVKLVKDLCLARPSPNRSSPSTSIYRMVTTFVPALSQRIHALAHGAPCRPRLPPPAAVLRSPFMRSSSSVFQPSTGYRPARSVRRWPRWPGPGSLPRPACRSVAAVSIWSPSSIPRPTSDSVPLPILHPHPGMRTSHLANLRSDSPRLSAASLLSSLSERRTTRAATVR